MAGYLIGVHEIKYKVLKQIAIGEINKGEVEKSKEVCKDEES